MRTNIKGEVLNKPPGNLRELQNYSQVIYDLIDQVLGYYIKEEKLWDQDILLESASYSAKGRCLKKVLKEEELLSLKKWLKVARYGRYANNDLDKLNSFINCTKELSDQLGLSEKDFDVRIPLQKKMLNSATVDTQYGFRSINLSHSDLIYEKTDLLILTSTFGEKPSGLFFERLANLCEYKEFDLNPFFSVDQQNYSSLIKGNELTGFKNLLVLILPKREDHSEEYLEKLKSTINLLINSSLAILEIQDKPIKSISLPVICGHRMKTKSEYDKLTKILISLTAKWLKKSEFSNEINIGVFYKSETNLWNDSMNNVLGRTPLDKGGFLNDLLHDFQRVLDRNSEGPLSSAILPMRENLYSSDKIGVENFLIHSRKLVEILITKMAQHFNVKLGGELMSNIEKFRHVRIAPWILSYMHTLRVFGNEGVHVRLDNKTYSPNQLSDTDFINGVTMLKALLIYWEDIIQKENKDFNNT